MVNMDYLDYSDYLDHLEKNDAGMTIVTLILFQYAAICCIFTLGAILERMDWIVYLIVGIMDVILYHFYTYVTNYWYARGQKQK